MRQLNDRTPFAIHNLGQLVKSVESLKARRLAPKELDGVFRKSMGMTAPLFRQLGIAWLAELCFAVLACPEGELRLDDTSTEGVDSFVVYVGDNEIGGFENSYEDINPHGGRDMRIGLQLRLTPYAQLYLDKQSGCPEAIDTIEDRAAAS